jgi:hypothetical protein
MSDDIRQNIIHFKSCTINATKLNVDLLGERSSEQVFDLSSFGSKMEWTIEIEGVFDPPPEKLTVRFEDDSGFEAMAEVKESEGKTTLIIDPETIVEYGPGWVMK